MAKIFISYRRDDSQYQADKLHGALKPYVANPQADIFIDIDNIPLGLDFADYIDGKVGQAEILLALIGHNWLNARDPKTGRRRLDDPKDFVCLEIASALRRGIPVVPVLFDGAPVPDAAQLPDDLKPLARRNGIPVNRASFDADVARLVRGLPVDLKGKRAAVRAAKGRWSLNLLLPAIIAVSLAVALLLVFNFRPPVQAGREPGQSIAGQLGGGNDRLGPAEQNATRSGAGQASALLEGAAFARREATVWQEAQSADTIEAYQAYLKQFGTGANAEQADKRIRALSMLSLHASAGAAAMENCPPVAFTVFFEWDRSGLSPAALSAIEAAVEDTRGCRTREVRIAAHTDTTHSGAYAVELSQRMADSVAAALAGFGVPGDRIVTEARGASQLAVATDQMVREPLNRRVDVRWDFEP